MGMPQDEFWNGSPELATAYRKADQLRRERKNQELWLQGIYICDALAATVGNMFSKTKYEYPSEPKALTIAEIEERKQRDLAKKQEQIKARFMSRALKINAKKGE